MVDETPLLTRCPGDDLQRHEFRQQWDDAGYEAGPVPVGFYCVHCLYRIANHDAVAFFATRTVAAAAAEPTGEGRRREGTQQ